MNAERPVGAGTGGGVASGAGTGEGAGGGATEDAAGAVGTVSGTAARERRSLRSPAYAGDRGGRDRIAPRSRWPASTRRDPSPRGVPLEAAARTGSGGRYTSRL